MGSYRAFVGEPKPPKGLEFILMVGRQTENGRSDENRIYYSQTENATLLRLRAATYFLYVSQAYASVLIRNAIIINSSSARSM